MGVPQGSPLSPGVFLIFLAPILEEIESTMTQELQLVIEIPAYVDDILICVLAKEGKVEMKKEVREAKKEVNRVAAK